LSYICSTPIEQNILNIITGAHTETNKGIFSVTPNALEKLLRKKIITQDTIESKI
tara:strand:+ start:746 stop:910 length:165 start_codon:yes stop_codon:yes gene_type:complete